MHLLLTIHVINIDGHLGAFAGFRDLGQGKNDQTNGQTKMSQHLTKP
jgi:hypothetical protein